MSQTATRYEGVTLTDQYLTVHFRMEVGTAARFVSVRIPVGDLARVGVVPAIDRHVRAELARAWQLRTENDEQLLPPWQTEMH